MLKIKGGDNIKKYTNLHYNIIFRFLRRVLCFAIIIIFAAALIYNFQIVPSLIPLTVAQTTSDVTYEIQQIISECVSKGYYNDIVSLKYNSDGNVVSLETDAGKIALLTSEITKSVISSVGEANKLTVSVPVGNLTGGAIFTGRGPNINIKLLISPKINCRIENEFYESGINQTLHRIVAVVETDVYALVPAKKQNIKVETKYCITETIIIGEVPDAYTKINRLDDELSESDIDDIYDFGATLQ